MAPARYQPGNQNNERGGVLVNKRLFALAAACACGAANAQSSVTLYGVVDVNAYLDFIDQYNEFIGHKLKPFKPMIDIDMRL